jgi:hypothetical protein
MFKKYPQITLTDTSARVGMQLFVPIALAPESTVGVHASMFTATVWHSRALVDVWECD